MGLIIGNVSLPPVVNWSSSSGRPLPLVSTDAVQFRHPVRCFARSGGSDHPAAVSGTSQRGAQQRQRVILRASVLEDPVTAGPSGRQERDIGNGICEGEWTWRGYKIRYQRSGDSGPPVVCVHGFGGNCDHWRKNLPVLGQTCRAYAVDLLGYGYSDKPDPRSQPPNTLYCFETWGAQLADFISAKLGGEPTLLITNSVGGLAGLQAAIDAPDRVRAVQVMNISLRMLHTTKQRALARPFVALLQRTLRDTDLGRRFFGTVAQPRTVKNILQQCYGDKSAVTDELVDKILRPGLQPGAVDVFLDFISYSGGPLPEEQLQQVQKPVSILWGQADPWEKVEWGRQFQQYPSVEEFIELPGVGHCPMDEAPEMVNPHIQAFIARHSSGNDKH